MIDVSSRYEACKLHLSAGFLLAKCRKANRTGDRGAWQEAVSNKGLFLEANSYTKIETVLGTGL